jgi:hypothetical protein
MRSTLTLVFVAAVACACSPATVIDTPVLVRSDVECKSEVPVGSRRPQEVCTTAEQRAQQRKKARATLEDQQQVRGEPIMRQ